MSAPHMPMMNGDGVLNCPFCGSDAYTDNDGLHSYYVRCSCCGCSTDYRITGRLAIRQWNTRNGHLYTADDFKQAAQERE